jgi:hypothetical protein
MERFNACSDLLYQFQATFRPGVFSALSLAALPFCCHSYLRFAGSVGPGGVPFVALFHKAAAYAYFSNFPPSWPGNLILPIFWLLSSAAWWAGFQLAKSPGEYRETHVAAEQFFFG